MKAKLLSLILICGLGYTFQLNATTDTQKRLSVREMVGKIENSSNSSKANQASGLVVNPGKIQEITKQCEAEVKKYCEDYTCKNYCNKINTPNCSTICPKEYCKVKAPNQISQSNFDPKPASTPKTNLNPVEADNFAKFIACVAEKRDPSGRTSGRDTSKKWSEVKSIEMQKLLGER